MGSKANVQDGSKFDNKKQRWDLLPFQCIQGAVEVLTYGARKYTPNNWQKVPCATERYFAALMRHLNAWRLGESIDPESGLHHLKHALTNVIFLMWFELKKKLKKND